LAAIGFAFYGGRLYFMLKQFPIELKGRRSKLKEVMILLLLQKYDIIYFHIGGMGQHHMHDMLLCKDSNSHIQYIQ
jgi:hypothetical protein